MDRPDDQVTTPPRVWFQQNGESEGGSDRGGEVPWDTGRTLRGLPLEVQPVARWLVGRLRPNTTHEEPPTPGSIEMVAAAVQAVRSAILDGADAFDEARLRAMHAQLDRDVVVLAAKVLDRHATDSRALLRDVSHDLRSPLNSILFLADALATEHSGELNDVQRRQVGVLYSAAVSLVGLVNDLIDVSRIGDAVSIEVVSEPFSVEATLQQVDQLVGPLAAHGDVELAFRLETLGPRMGDRRILTRVLINLVTNAVNATGAGDRVEVRAVERDGDLRITVTDSGTDADVEEIRARLTRAPLPSPTQRERGWTHGLGLAICARLVDAAGGTIGADRESAGGCMFTIDLPFPRG